MHKILCKVFKPLFRREFDHNSMNLTEGSTITLTPLSMERRDTTGWNLVITDCPYRPQNLLLLSLTRIKFYKMHTLHNNA